MPITQRFCALCGKKLEEGVFCSECRRDAHPPKIVKVKTCSKCGSFFYANKKIRKTLSEFLKENFTGNYEADISEIMCKDCNPKQFKAKVQLRGFDFDERELGRFSAFVKEVVKKKEGSDIHFSDAKRAFDYVKEFKKNNDCEFKKTSSLVTQRKDGKKVFRPTFLLRRMQSKS